MYYDREGRPIDMMTMCVLAANLKYKILLQDDAADGTWVSTVWLGTDHNFGGGPPLIFETMVFPKQGDWNDLDCERYSTEREAIDGHVRMLTKRGGRKP